MAEGKNIEIKIAATGGDQAAAEITKVQTAAENAASNTGMGGMLDGVPERLQEITKNAEVLTESTGDIRNGIEEVRAELGPLTEQVAAVGGNAGQSAGKLDKLVNLERAQVANQIANGLAQIGREVQAASQKFAESDPEFSRTLENIASGIDSASGALAGAAQGFAVGGPFGAAVGALAGSLLPQVKRAFDEMTTSIIAANESEARAVQLKNDLTAAQENFAAAVLTDEITEQYERQAEALQGLIDKLAHTKKVVAAEDALNAAKRDNQDAAAIRDGAAPEDVRVKRAVDDGIQAKARVDYELGLEKTMAIEKQNLAEKLQQELKKLQEDGGATAEQITTAQEVVTQATNEASNQDHKLRNESELAPLEKAAIDTRTQGKVSDLTAQKNTRIEREQKAKERPSMNASREKATENKASKEASDAEADRRSAGKVGRDVEKMLPDNITEKFRAAVEKASVALQDGGTVKELSTIADLLTQLGASTNSSLTGVRSQIAAAQAEINILKQRGRGK